MLFKDEKFGMFIHWGIYSVNAWHEQDQWRRQIPKEEYIKLAERFNPTEFDIDKWMELIKSAGMQYICFTTKHHDGFCMWDTKYTDYNIMNTPYKKDILKEIADGCNRHGIKLALYYSCPDWNYKHSVNFGGDHQLIKPNPGDEPNEELYKEYIKNQMKELLGGKYGKIDALFWDIPPYNEDKSVNEFVRLLRPDILINDRGYSKGDYSTPERNIPEGKAFKSLTEACQSVSSISWGYRNDDDFFSALFLMESIDKIMSRGGNYLLNVGPDAMGNFPAEAIKKIKKAGDWFNRISESLIYAKFVENNEIPYRLTANDDYLYIHFDGMAVSSGISLMPINIAPTEAIVLNDGTKVDAKVECIPSHYVGSGKPIMPYLHVNQIPVDELTNEPIILRLKFENMQQIHQILSGKSMNFIEIL